MITDEFGSLIRAIKTRFAEDPKIDLTGDLMWPMILYKLLEDHCKHYSTKVAYPSIPNDVSSFNDNNRSKRVKARVDGEVRFFYIERDNKVKDALKEHIEIYQQNELIHIPKKRHIAQPAKEETESPTKKLKSDSPSTLETIKGYSDGF